MSDIYQKRGKRYYRRSDLDALSHFDAHSLIIGAQRYYIGRMTIAANCFAQSELAAAWPHLPAGTRSVMQRGIEEEFLRDDEARAEGSNYKPLGWDCDRAAWAKVREHWHGKDVPLAPHVPTRTEIVRRLGLLAAQMQELGEAMVYVGGFDGRMAARGEELAGAGGIAAAWVDEIKDVAP